MGYGRGPPEEDEVDMVFLGLVFENRKFPEEQNPHETFL
jgi:hypothetical protein